jgi:hypothetical protein
LNLTVMTAIGRKQTVKFVESRLIERPLLVKADIPPGTPKIGSPNGRYAPQNRHSAKLGLKGCL